MLTSKRSDFFYTLTEDEQKFFASIRRAEQDVKKIRISKSHKK